ncbi:hypothetical protein CK203_044008 [Vitis vinifera]|uniref:Uncharacterized protein n=1 Tax=Vitis vinifera TaxID=29760 RepID=A0A438HTK9_VITVI|nr:hypothetical protein CK203_044008 [Vitis vinifera]
MLPEAEDYSEDFIIQREVFKDVGIHQEAVSEFVEEGDLNTFFLVVQQLFGCPLHAHIMAASVVTLFQWRLNSMLLQENEILLGVKDQIESLINKLDAVGSFTRDVDRILGRDSYHPTWASE